MLPPLEPPRLSASEPRAGAGGDEKEKTAIHDSSDPDVVAVNDGDNNAVPLEDGNSDVVVVDYDEMDAENPLTWSPTRKWLLVFAISWMGFVSVFATMTITPTAPQILQRFHSHSSLDRTLLVTIWELGECIGPFFIAPLSERFGRLPVFHLGNLLGLVCLAACALSVNMPMLIVFRFLTGVCLPTPTLAPAIVGDLFETELTGLSMGVVVGPQIIADFVSAVAGAYVAEALGWRWSIWLSAIVLGFFSSLLLAAFLRETYAVVILRRKAARLQAERADGKRYRSKHQAEIDTSTRLQRITRPVQILAKSPILMLTQGYMAIAYALVYLITVTLTESMESTYPGVFSQGSIGLAFLSLAIGNTIALFFYTFTSDRYVSHEREKKGDAFKPEARLAHVLIAAICLPLAFLLYGWTLESHVQYIVPLIGAALGGWCMTLAVLPVETYVVDVYEIHGASAIAAGVVIRAFTGTFLPLIGPALYQSIGQGWGNTVLALVAAAFILPLGALARQGDWFRSKERFGPSGR